MSYRDRPWDRVSGFGGLTDIERANRPGSYYPNQHATPACGPGADDARQPNPSQVTGDNEEIRRVLRESVGSVCSSVILPGSYPDAQVARITQRQVHRERDRLAAICNENARLIAELRERLACMVNPSTPHGPVGVVPASDQPAMAPLAEGLDAIAFVVEGSNMKLRALLDSVEV